MIKCKQFFSLDCCKGNSEYGMGKANLTCTPSHQDMDAWTASASAKGRGRLKQSLKNEIYLKSEIIKSITELRCIAEEHTEEAAPLIALLADVGEDDCLMQIPEDSVLEAAMDSQRQPSGDEVSKNVAQPALEDLAVTASAVSALDVLVTVGEDDLLDLDPIA